MVTERLCKSRVAFIYADNIKKAKPTFSQLRLIYNLISYLPAFTIFLAFPLFLFEMGIKGFVFFVFTLFLGSAAVGT